MQLINPSTSPNELNTTLTPHSIIHGDACFAYFNKNWDIPVVTLLEIKIAFGPEDTAAMITAFEEALNRLNVADREAHMGISVAKKSSVWRREANAIRHA